MVRIRKVKLENYRGVKSEEFEPAKSGIIFNGQNGIGKTSRIEAIYWCLTGVLFDNSSKGITDKIKTLKTGKKPPLTVELEVVGDYDEVFYIKKTVNEKWVLKDDTDIEVYDGDDISYYINEQKYIKRDYDAIINRIFGIEHLIKDVQQDAKFDYLKKVDWFNLITNPTYFKKLDKKTQREVLIFTVGDLDLNMFDMSDDVAELIQDKTLDQVKKEIHTTIKEVQKEIEHYDVKLSTLKNDMSNIICPHCGLEFSKGHIDFIESVEHNRHDAQRLLVKYESLLAEVETIEVEYLTTLDEKVRDAFDEYAHIEIIDDNLNPTVKILLRDNMGQWVDIDNGINTGDGILRLTVFISFMKMLLLIPSSIIFFDSLESLDIGNTQRLLGIDEQFFGTQVIPNQKGLQKKLVARNTMEVMVHEI